MHPHNPTTRLASAFSHSLDPELTSGLDAR
jgi:hypothetical protein